MKQSLDVTLAQLVKQVRESQYLSIEQLAEATQLSLETLEDLEAGIQLFLSPSQRQKLARGLKLSPKQIKNLEKEQPATDMLADKKMILAIQVRRNPEGQYYCPQCQSQLMVRIFERRDIDDNLVMAYKMQCSKCPFQESIE